MPEVLGDVHGDVEEGQISNGYALTLEADEGKKDEAVWEEEEEEEEEDNSDKYDHSAHKQTDKKSTASNNKRDIQKQDKKSALKAAYPLPSTNTLFESMMFSTTTAWP